MNIIVNIKKLRSLTSKCLNNALRKSHMFYLITYVMLLSCILCLFACGKKDEEYDYSIGLITTTSGIHDQGFSQMIWEGLLKVKEKHKNVRVSYLDSQIESDYAINAQIFADNDYDLIIGSSFSMKDIIEEAAKDKPDLKYIMIDEIVELPNVSSVVFKMEEGSYLAGVVAACMTKTNKIGFMEGMYSKTLNAFGVGYIEGAKSINKDISIFQKNVNGFADATLGNTIAKSMINNGADIIFAAAGNSGIGAINCCTENGKFAIGVDVDQSFFAPNNVLTSVVKRVDLAIIDICEDYIKGKFEAGTKVVDIKSGGVGLADGKHLIPKNVWSKVEKAKRKIIDGEIKVHSDVKDCPDFTITG